MKYSKAFKSLWRMSSETNIVAASKRERVAFFLGRIAVAEQHLGSLKDAEKYLNYKNDALHHLVKITDTEWEMIQEVMEENINEMIASTKWKVMHRNWVYALDTLRAFS
jgi:hypothetical protein